MNRIHFVYSTSISYPKIFGKERIGVREGGTKKIAKMGFITLKRFSLSLSLSLAHTQTYIHTRAA
jgi:hypothetical protein